jgi:hypothetical protein
VGPIVSGRFDESLLVTHVMVWLTELGVRPELRASEIEAAERAAADLLRALDVEPIRLSELE